MEKLCSERICSGKLTGILRAVFRCDISWRVVVGAVAISFAVRPVQAWEEPPLDSSLNERILNVTGDPPHPAMLQVTTFTPNGPGPFPLAILNHGKEVGLPKDQPRYRSAYIARYFLSRGYAVALPMMRGFAGSGGVFDPHGCDVEAEGLGQAADIAAVISYLARQPNIDPSRVVVSGQSLGGWNTLAFGVNGYPGVKGLLNFAGGVREPNCPTWGQNLITAAGHFGARSRLPSLWFYGDNDGTFPASVWRAMYDRYVRASGKAELVAYGNFISDAHNMIGSLEGFPIWMPKVDAFLENLGLPGKLVAAQYLPAPFPPPTDFAKIDDIDAIPFATGKTKELYKQFLTKPFPRVFLISPSGGGGSFDGG